MVSSKISCALKLITLSFDGIKALCNILLLFYTRNENSHDVFLVLSMLLHMRLSLIICCFVQIQFKVIIITSMNIVV